MKDKDQNYIEVQVKGRNKILWSELKTKLYLAISKALDTVVNYDENTTIREEGKEFISAIIAHAKAKLKKPGIENQKRFAEISLLYTQKEKEIAVARKLNAESTEIEINNMIKSLKISLGGLKAFTNNSYNPEDIVFLKQIDSFLDTLNSIC